MTTPIWFLSPVKLPETIQLLDGTWLGVAIDGSVSPVATRVGSAAGIAFHHDVWAGRVFALPGERVSVSYLVTTPAWNHGWCEATIVARQSWPQAHPLTPSLLLDAARQATAILASWLTLDAPIALPFERFTFPPSATNTVAEIRGNNWSIIVRSRPHTHCDCDLCAQFAPPEIIQQWVQWRFRGETGGNA